MFLKMVGSRPIRKILPSVNINNKNEYFINKKTAITSEDIEARYFEKYWK